MWPRQPEAEQTGIRGEYSGEIDSETGGKWSLAMAERFG